MNRRQFLGGVSMIGATLAFGTGSWAAESAFPVVRVAQGKRKFTSPAVEAAIARIESSIGNKELAWMFENCFPNTLDTTVDFQMIDRRPDTYVITGDIDAMWLRDSSAQVWPYLPLMAEDPRLQQLIAGVINRQTRCVLNDPYANAFYKDQTKISDWKSDLTTMKPGVHERKWEIDSLCYTVRLAHGYWKLTGDTKPFDESWQQAIAAIYQTFQEQQRKTGNGPYQFRRRTETATDTLPGGGYGRPAKPVGLICSMFRPSDDATVFSYLVPSNFFAVISLRQAAEMLVKIRQDNELAAKCRAMADEVEQALHQYAVVNHAQLGKVYAYEVDAYGNYYCIDDGNVPSLLSLPYLGAVAFDDPIYQATRRLVLSGANPYYCKGAAAEGPGGPHVGLDMIWPLGVAMRGITATDEAEIKQCLTTLQKTHAGTGFMHEAFHKDDPKRFTRSWFAWANTLFGEFILKVAREHPRLLD
jgi:uncharacterized protein